MVGQAHWTRRAAAVRADIKGHPFLREYLTEQNAVVLALDKWTELAKKYGQIPLDRVNDRTLYPALQLAAQMLSLMNGATKDEVHRLKRRLHGAFNNPDELRAIQFELGVATHFTRRGLSVSWPEFEGQGTFDFLLPELVPHGLEIECKSVSTDKGRKIHRREALECLSAIERRLEKAVRNLHSGLAVVWTIPDRLTPRFADRQKLLDGVARTILAGRNAVLEDGSEIRINDFDIAKYPDLGPPLTPDIRADVDQITGTRNRQTMIVGRRDGGALVFVIQSRIEDALLDYTFDSAARGARDQLSGTRAGVVAIRFEDISPAELVSTAQQDKDPSKPVTALRMAASKFLDGPSRKHVAGIAFLSQDALREDGPGGVSSGGDTYYFSNSGSTFWQPELASLFASMGGRGSLNESPTSSSTSPPIPTP